MTETVYVLMVQDYEDDNYYIQSVHKTKKGALDAKDLAIAPAPNHTLAYIKECELHD